MFKSFLGLNPPWAESPPFPLPSPLSGPARKPPFPLPRLGRPASAQPSPAPIVRSDRSVRSPERSARASSFADARDPPVSAVVFNRPAVLPLGRAARFRFLRATTPRPPRLQPPPNLPRAHDPAPSINPPPRLSSLPQTDRALSHPKTAAALGSPSSRRLEPRRSGWSRLELLRAARGPFDATPSRPDRCTAASTTTTPSRSVRRRQASSAPPRRREYFGKARRCPLFRLR